MWKPFNKKWYFKIRGYVLTLFASFCDGKIQEKFHIFLGCGGNGKSKLIELFQNAMGHCSDSGGYCGNLPVTALTKSSSETSEHERLEVVQEPDQQETLKSHS